MPYNVSEPRKRELKASGLEAIECVNGEWPEGAWRFQRPDGRCYLVLGGIDVAQVDAILRALYLVKGDGFSEAQQHVRQALGL